MFAVAWITSLRDMYFDLQARSTWSSLDRRELA
jgi:hypothetical protein